MKKTLGRSIPHTTKQIQDLNSDMCGWFCLAFFFYIHTYPKRTKDLYQDVSNFLGFFDDLSKDENLVKKKEFILKHFFRSDDPKLRKKIDVDDYSHIENKDTAIPVEGWCRRCEGERNGSRERWRRPVSSPAEGNVSYHGERKR